MKRLFLIGCVLIISAGISVAQQDSSAPPPLKITNGPKVEFTGTDRAIVAWSTNVSGATIVHYGTDPNDLSQKAMAPWGALTHRVTLKKLQPNTKYYFKVDSTENGSAGESGILQFETKPGATSASR